MTTTIFSYTRPTSILALALATVVLGFAISGCGASSEASPTESPDSVPNGQRPVVTFSVDDELLGAAVEFDDSGVRIRPPFGWFVITDVQSEQIQQGLAPLLNPEYSYETEQIYFDGDSNTVLLVTAPKGDHSMEAHAGYYEEALDVQELRLDRFMFGEYELDQLVLVEPGMVVLRYLLRHAEHNEVEIIFAVPAAEFADMIPVVESVVGSALPL